MQTINNHEEALFKQLDILLVNEPDTSRNGDKYLDWKNALSEVREQIDALHQDPGWDNVHESSQAERATTLDKTVEKTLNKCIDAKAAAPARARSGGEGGAAQARPRGMGSSGPGANYKKSRRSTF